MFWRLQVDGFLFAGLLGTSHLTTHTLDRIRSDPARYLHVGCKQHSLSVLLCGLTPSLPAPAGQVLADMARQPSPVPPGIRSRRSPCDFRHRRAA